MNEIVLPILVLIAVLALGSVLVLLAGWRGHMLKPRLGRLDERPEPAERVGPRVVDGVSRLGRALSLGRISSRLSEQLTRAGYYRDSAAATYLGAKLLLLLVGACGSAAVFVPMELSAWIVIYLVGLVTGVCFFLPNLFVRMKRRKRTTEVRNHLPDAVDLLEVCVSAGMGLDSAWNAVSDEVREVSPTLADEMALVNLEIQLGSSRSTAMRNMAARTGADELSSLVALLIQCDRFGTSITDALRTYATSMRESRSMRAEEAAEKTAVKLLFPMVLFIFPVMLIVVVGPAGITLVHVLGSR